MKIQAVDLAHSYLTGGSRRQVLADINLTITEPRVGIVGHNGSGKSTFVRMINGLIQPNTGKLLVDGLDTAKDAAKIRKQVGFLFTDPDAQIIMPTVAEDVAFGLRKAKLTNNEKQARVMAMLRKFELAGHAEHPAHLLSGGQKQLLALSSVLITEPKLIVMDEPTTLLDLRNARRIREVIAGLDQQVVLVTHQLEQLADFDRVIVFDQGRVVADDDPRPAIDYYKKLILDD